MASTIFNSATEVKTLAANLSLNDTAKILQGSDDPTSVAKDAPRGSIYLRTGASGGDVYKKLDNGSTTNWELLGAGGASGINYIENNAAEVGTTGWATYADAAGAAPVDGTGGSATVTFTTTTSTPLRGNASFLITKDAANRQGEGASYDFVIDEADKSKVLAISFDYSTSANFANDDVVVYIYDKDNTSLITPVSIDLKAGSGTFQTTFSATTADDYRLILHVSSTNANAYTVKLDNVIVGPQSLTVSPVISDWQDMTAQVSWDSAWGTVSETYYYARRIGDSLHVRGKVKVGTPTANPIIIPLPSGLTIDTTKFVFNSTATLDNLHILGLGSLINTATGADEDPGYVFYTDSGYISWDNRQNNLEFRESNVNSVFSSGDVFIFEFMAPISQWDGGSPVLQNATTFKISSFLANGTRVTSDPVAFGQYRTLIKDSSAFTYTDNAPTAAPSTSNGMRVYAKNYATAGTSGETNKWVIFVGKNKQVKVEFYSSAGKTGFVDVANTVASATEQNGVTTSYDPTTGLVVVDAAANASTGIATRTCGYAPSTGATGYSNPADVYFDVVVSEKVVPVQIEAVNSVVDVHTGNGHGSSNANRRFSTVLTNRGDAITYADSSTDGASWTINEDGIYTMDSVDIANGGNYEPFISINQVAPGSVVVGTRLVATFIPNGERVAMSATTRLTKGDVIRVSAGNTNALDSNDIVRFRITKVSN